MNTTSIEIPLAFGFKDHGIFDFDKALKIFKWDLKNQNVIIDARNCFIANYQALSLLPLYIWHLRSQGCYIDLQFSKGPRGAGGMWYKMGAQGWAQVLMKELQNFNGHPYKPLLAIRNNSDFKKALSRAEEYTKDFNVEYEKTLRYVISELLYNTLEHGKSTRLYNNKPKQVPSLIQFTWYINNDELHFIVSDIGIGIKAHLEQTYPTFEDDKSAILEAIKYKVSGTFGISNPYRSKDNAGVGLFISSNIIRKLNADMHILSGNGLVHISPRDTTSHTTKYFWPGTIVLVSLKLGEDLNLNLHQFMSELRESAATELKFGEDKEKENILYINISNYFGKYAEEKETAIKFRDNRILPALEQNKNLILDFVKVVSAPHSFLSALLATPIKRLGLDAYKKIKIVNAEPEIRETIDYILDDNTA